MMSSRPTRFGPLRLLPLLLLAASCDMVLDSLESQAGLSGEGKGERELTLVVIAGNEQTGVVGERLSEPVQVVVVDEDGQPRPGARVRFVALEGSGQFEPPEQVTNEAGVVQARWTLGQRSGDHAAHAIIDAGEEPGDSVALHAVAMPGAPRNLAAVEGGGQTGTAGTTLAAPLVVSVTDRFGNPAAEVAVRWTALSGGGSFDPEVSHTDDEGRASTRWTLGLAQGTQSAVARVDGVDPVVFEANGTRTIETLSIEPASVQLEALRETVRLTARAYDATGAEWEDVNVSWKSLDPSIATVGNNGLVDARANGVARIVATAGGASDTARVTVAQKGSRVEAEPGSIQIDAIGDEAQATAMVLDANGYEVSGAEIEWSSSAPSIAQVNGMGRIVAKGVGKAFVIASAACCAADTVAVDVRQVVAAVQVTPSSISLAVGAELQIVAVAVDKNGIKVDSAQLSWQSSDPDVASVTSSGLVRAREEGTADISVTANGKTATARVTVTAAGGGGDDDDEEDEDAPVASVSVSPSSFSLTVGGTRQLNVTLKDASGNTLTGRTVTWKSSAAAVATVSAIGLVTAIGPGTATITATSEGKSATAQVTVSPVPVASVSVSPSSFSLPVGDTRQLSVTLKDASGNTLTGRTVNWSSSATSVATVNSSGRVTAVGAGTATITATSEGKSGTAQVTVTGGGPAPVASVTVSPSSASLTVGETRQLSATLKDASGNTLTGRTVNWSSSSTSVATVNSNGLVTAVGSGTATITATSEGKSGTSTITVSSPPPPGQFSPPDILSHNFENGKLSPFTDGGGGQGNSNIYVANDPTGQFGGKVVHIRYNGCSDVNRFIGGYHVGPQNGGFPLGSTVYVRGHFLIGTPQQDMRNAQRKLIYVQREPNDGSYIVLKADDGRLKLEWPSQPWVAHGPTIDFNRKYSLELGFRLNSSVGARDGWMRVWLDGQLVIEVTNTDIVVNNPGSLIRHILVGNQSQGHNLQCHDEMRYWDNVAISTKRIGP